MSIKLGARVALTEVNVATGAAAPAVVPVRRADDVVATGDAAVAVEVTVGVAFASAAATTDCDSSGCVTGRAFFDTVPLRGLSSLSRSWLGFVFALRDPEPFFTGSTPAGEFEFDSIVVEPDGVLRCELRGRELDDPFFVVFDPLVADVATFASFVAEFVDEWNVFDSDDSFDPDEEESVPSAQAAPLAAKIPTPIPSATANAPTLPTYAPAAMIPIPSTRPYRYELAAAECKGNITAFDGIDDMHSFYIE